MFLVSVAILNNCFNNYVPFYSIFSYSRLHLPSLLPPPWLKGWNKLTVHSFNFKCGALELLVPLWRAVVLLLYTLLYLKLHSLFYSISSCGLLAAADCCWLLVYADVRLWACIQTSCDLHGFMSIGPFSPWSPIIVVFVLRLRFTASLLLASLGFCWNPSPLTNTCYCSCRLK